MSTDRELLELAARAAGYIDFSWNVEPRARCHNGVASYWNPLTDDGEALRLAVKLRMLVEIDHYHAMADGNIEDLAGGADPFAATRRAIVRAAAEIGRATTQTERQKP